MTKDFLKNFPSLKGRGKWIENFNDSVDNGDNWYQELIIQKHTIDKQRARDVIKKYLQGLANDYGYCNCKKTHKDIHMDICNDIEKIQKLLLKELELED